MKRNIFVLFIIFSIISFINVKAAKNYKTVDQDYHLLCEYVGEGTEDIIKLYYKPTSVSSKFAIAYTTNTKDYNLINKSSDNFFDVLGLGQTAVHYNSQDNRYKSDDELTFTCSPYAFLNTGGRDEICFTNKTTSCGDKFTKRQILHLTNNSYFNQINTIFKTKSTEKLERLTIDQFYQPININDEVRRETKKELTKDGTKLPTFIENYIDNKRVICDTINTKIRELRDALQAKRSSMSEEDYNNYNFHLENFANSFSVGCDVNSDFGVKPPKVDDPEENEKEPEDFSHTCEEFAKGIKMLGLVLFLAKIVIPLIIVVKATFNLVTVVLGAKFEALSKYLKKLFISLLAGIAIFFAPSVINGVFNLVDTNKNKENVDIAICRNCIFRPFSDECNKHIKKEN